MTSESGDQVLLPIPASGLEFVLRSWVGRGALTSLLSASDELPVEWSAKHLRRRIDLVLLLRILPLVERLPVDISAWEDILPAESHLSRERQPRPSGATDWVETRIREGWPPREFHGRPRLRHANQSLLELLEWVAIRLVDLAEAARHLDQGITLPIRRQISTLSRVIERTRFSGQSPAEPQLADLRDAEREGRHWRVIAQVARQLREARDPWLLAMELIEPIPELKPTFFQLGVLGEILVALRANDFSLRSVAPLGSGVQAEHYKAGDGTMEWDIWMEASALWSRYHRVSPYRRMTAQLATNTRPLSPDILIVAPGIAAFIVECKYSANDEYIGRRGLAQTSLYMAELSGLVAPRVEGVVAVPSGVVAGATSVMTVAGRLGIAGPEDAAAAVVRFMQSTAQMATE